MTSHRESAGEWCQPAPPGRNATRLTCMPAEAADFAPVRFSTRELPERDRLSMWREEFGRGVVRTDIEPLPGPPFRAEATLRALPGLRTIVYTGSPVCNRRTPAHAADGDDCIGLFVNLGRRATASQRGRDVVLGTGDAVLISHEPSIVTPSPDGSLGVIVPRDAVASRLSDIDDAIMQLIGHRTEPLRLLISYMSVLREDLILGSPKLRRTVVSHIHDLVALALSQYGAAREGGMPLWRAPQCGTWPYRRELRRPATHGDGCGLQAAHLPALSAAPPGDVGYFIHCPRERVALATGFHVADGIARGPKPHFRCRVAGRLLRYFALQPLVQIPLRRSPSAIRAEGRAAQLATPTATR